MVSIGHKVTDGGALMSSVAQAKFDDAVGMDAASVNGAAPARGPMRPEAIVREVTLEIHDALAPVERRWRAFEQTADVTAFQSFDWLAAWQHHIGEREGVRPVVVVGSAENGETLFIMPLAIVRRAYGRVLTFLGAELGDYNAPLLAPEFARRVPDPLALMRRVFAAVRSHAAYDVIAFEGMPETIGAQPNPLLTLPIMLHPSGAYMTPLGDDWKAFYAEKRSSSTRQRDRAKRKKLGGFGEVRIVHPLDERDIVETLDTLMAQKGRAFDRMGVSNMFKRPGYREFFRAVATAPASRHLVHVSGLKVGDETAAANLGLTFRDRYYYILASYSDGDVARFGPGAAHLRDLMEYATGRGFRVFDFTVGDEPYKREWCDESLLYDYIAGAGARGTVVAAVLRKASAAKRAIKRNPRLWTLAYKMREKLGRLRR